MRTWILMAAMGLMAAAVPASAEQGYLMITGTGGQVIRGEMTEGNKKDQHEVIDFKFATPASPVAHAAVGRRTAVPVKFTLRWNRSTWALLRAQAKNEILQSVRLSVWGKPAEDTGIPITLNDQLEFVNARITAVQILDRNGADGDIEPVVEVTLSYRTMRITHMQGGMVWEDTWTEQ